MLTAGMLFRPHTSHYLLASFLSVGSLAQHLTPFRVYGLARLFFNYLANTLYSSVDCSLPPHIATRPFFFIYSSFWFTDCSLPPLFAVISDAIHSTIAVVVMLLVVVG